MTEADIDEPLQVLLDQMRGEDKDFRNTFRKEFRKATNWDLGGEAKKDDEQKKRTDQAKWFKQLDQEKARLTLLLADSELDRATLREVDLASF